VADGYLLHADDTYIPECCVRGTTAVLLWYKERYSEPRPPLATESGMQGVQALFAFADLPRLDFALHFALTGVERERDAPCSTLALESLRTSAPRSSYHSKQRLHYSTCAFAQLMPCHDIPIQASREVTSTFQSCPLQSNVVFDLVLLTQRMESNGI